MTEWTDPQVVVALMAGASGLVVSGIAILMSRKSLKLTRKHSQNQAIWEEYRDRVYNEVSVALKDFEASAHLSSLSPNHPKREDCKKYFVGLSEAMNQVDIVCGRAAKHPKTKDDDWEVTTEQCAQAVHGVIGSFESQRDSDDEEGLGAKAEELRNAIEIYLDIVGAKLRKQREHLTAT